MKGNFRKAFFVFFMLLFAVALSGCSGSIFSLPQKVTIQKKDPAAVAPAENTEEVTPTPTPTPAPEVLQAVSTTEEEREKFISDKRKAEAVEAANHRLDTGFYSRDTLVAGLVEDGFSQEEAEYGADNCYVTWGSGDDMAYDAAGTDAVYDPSAYGEVYEQPYVEEYTEPNVEPQ